MTLLDETPASSVRPAPVQPAPAYLSWPPPDGGGLEVPEPPAWRRWVARRRTALLAAFTLAAIVAVLVWGSVSASAAGGCGGG